MSELKAHLDKSVKHLELEFHKLQLGRANPALIEDIKVEVYGDLQPIKNVASINIMDNQTLSVQPWDKSVLNDLSKAILEANLGFNPQGTSEGIIIRVPQLTEERRREVAKFAKTLMEDAKVAVRNARQDELKRIKGDEDLSDDMKKDAESDVQKSIDEANKKIEELYKKKEADIMKV